MRHVNTPMNYEETELSFEFLSDKSETMPEQSMDLREILHRYANGQDLTVGNGLEYMEDDQIDDSLGLPLQKLDIVEISALKSHFENNGKQSEQVQELVGENIQDNPKSETASNDGVSEDK